MKPRRPFVGGNWKMNTDRRTAHDLARAVAEGLAGRRPAWAGNTIDAAVYPPFVYLALVAQAIAAPPSNVALGAQDLYDQPSGAFTGEVSAPMLLDIGCSSVLTGHSERRHVLGESEETVARKTRAALDAPLTCVLCVGEKLEERTAGTTDAVNERQLRTALAGVPKDRLARLVIAYEPVWAIGTGKTATPADAQAAHLFIRAVLASQYDPAVAATVRIIYGGSVKPSSALELASQPDIDGFLVGGASLVANDFLDICDAAAVASTRKPSA